MLLGTHQEKIARITSLAACKEQDEVTGSQSLGQTHTCSFRLDRSETHLLSHSSADDMDGATAETPIGCASDPFNAGKGTTGFCLPCTHNPMLLKGLLMHSYHAIAARHSSGTADNGL